jgi:hypothetical protein
VNFAHQLLKRARTPAPASTKKEKEHTSGIRSSRTRPTSPQHSSRRTRKQVSTHGSGQRSNAASGRRKHKSYFLYLRCIYHSSSERNETWLFCIIYVVFSWGPPDRCHSFLLVSPNAPKQFGPGRGRALKRNSRVRSRSHEPSR